MDISNKLPRRIPIFPLSNFIVFPDTTVPLNIFEQRYIQMIDDSMTTNRLIGMIQPKKSIQSKTPDLFDVGCLCKITSFNETDDGRYIIILKGISRFNKEGKHVTKYSCKACCKIIHKYHFQKRIFTIDESTNIVSAIPKSPKVSLAYL